MNRHLLKQCYNTVCSEIPFFKVYGSVHLSESAINVAKFLQLK